MVIIILLNCLVQMKNEIISFMIFFLSICFICINKKVTNYFKKITYNKIILTIIIKF